jgi:ATP-binding cassette subfamily B protein
MQVLTKQTLLIFWQHVRRYRGQFFVIISAVFLGACIELGFPFILKYFFDTLAQHDVSLVPNLRNAIFAYGALHVLSWLVWRTISYVNNRFQPRVMADLLDTCYQYVHDHSYRFFTDNFVGSLVAKIRRYPRSFEAIADQLCFDLGRILVLRAGLIIVVLFIYSWQIGLMVFIWAILFVSFNYLFSLYKLKYDIQRSAMDTEITAQLADTVTNNINLKLFATARSEYKIFASITNRWERIQRWTWDLGSVADATQNVFMIILEVAILWVGVHYWRIGKFTVGDLVLLQGYMWQIFDNLNQVGRNIRNLYEAIADANEMTEILTHPHEVVNAPGAPAIQVTRGEIEFKGATFNYKNNKEIFSNFNLTIPAGQKVALVGSSGGGKSTVVKLILRFYDLKSGQILVDGQDISQVTQESLRQQIALVPQDPILFHRPILENIRYARPTATDDEVIEVAKMAHCHEFVTGFADGYATMVGERGVKLSGGERQRVAIARALLKQAPVLILDEATSSLDSESEYFIQDALKNLMRGKTTIVIAHRLSTIMQMDRILVLDSGRVIEEGKHEELVKAKTGMYQKLWQIQAGGFEATSAVVGA